MTTMQRRLMSIIFLAFIICVNLLQAQSICTNPLKDSGPDPWVIYKNGWFCYMNTFIKPEGENDLRLWRTKNMYVQAA